MTIFNAKKLNPQFLDKLFKIGTENNLNNLIETLIFWINLFQFDHDYCSSLVMVSVAAKQGNLLVSTYLFIKIRKMYFPRAIIFTFIFIAYY